MNGLMQRLVRDRKTLQLLINSGALRHASVTSDKYPYYSEHGTHTTDYVAPDYEPYRRDSHKDPYTSSMDSEVQRKLYPYAMYGMFIGINVLYAKQLARLVVSYKDIPADVRAAGTTEIKISEIPEGETKLFTWRGSPVFVKHRTAADIEKEVAVPVSDLRHPQTDADRVKDPKWLIVIGVCTHLGCIPIANKGNWGGWYCPCHGSHYDGSGRIRKGPAPLNLEVPPYEFVDDDTVVVGMGA